MDVLSARSCSIASSLASSEAACAYRRWYETGVEFYIRARAQGRCASVPGWATARQVRAPDSVHSAVGQAAEAWGRPAALPAPPCASRPREAGGQRKHETAR